MSGQTGIKIVRVSDVDTIVARRVQNVSEEQAPAEGLEPPT